ncbi:MAG TPA: hypothetical protein VJC13_02620 [Candidatus Paceibacterota bacterium]
MPKKNVVQDVIPSPKSIRNVVLTPKFTARDRGVVTDIKINTKTIEPTIEPEPTPNYNYEYDEPVKPSKKLLYVSMAILVLAVAFGLSAFFKSAKITITPKQETRVLDAEFKALKNVSVGDLGFQIVSSTKDLQKTVVSSGETEVTTKAKGTIVVYNNTPQPQKLIINTRFQSPEGFIFRALGPVSIPAKQVLSGKSIAGSVEVLVQADKAGSGYNIGLKDFTIPGFKGDPKYTLIYARSKTEMKGGFSGQQSVVTKEVMDKTNAELEDALRSSLLKDINSQIPENFILYSTGLSYDFEPTVQVASSGNSTSTKNVVLNKKGRISGVIFDKASLSAAILTKIAQDISASPVIISNLNSLNFSFKSPDSNLNTVSSISFNLAGNADMVWTFDENRLKSDLLGLAKNAAKSVITTYHSVSEAWIETYPFWNQTIPSDPKKVTLINTKTP